jgi:predicted alpha/beta superfamily hydrolase
MAMPDLDEFDFEAGDGRIFRLFTSVPAVEPPPGGFRTLYVLDANAVFATLAQQAGAQAIWSLATGIDPIVIVGIGYPTDRYFDAERRAFDYTPPPLPGSAQTYYPLMSCPMGGADRFLDLIEREVAPAIEQRCPANPADRALMGHSFGGLFVLHALFRRPETFGRYVSLSPAIRWGMPALASSETEFRQRPDRPAGRRLLVAYGELENKPGPREVETPDLDAIMRYRDEHAMAAESAALVQRLRQLPPDDLATELVEYAGESHMSVVPAALSRALRFVCA